MVSVPSFGFPSLIYYLLYLESNKIVSCSSMKVLFETNIQRNNISLWPIYLFIKILFLKIKNSTASVLVQNLLFTRVVILCLSTIYLNGFSACTSSLIFSTCSTLWRIYTFTGTGNGYFGMSVIELCSTVM